MLVQIVTYSVEGLSGEEREIFCRECIEACNRLAGVRAHRWTLNERTDTLSGTVQWTDYEAIAEGSETLRMHVATLHSDRLPFTCRDVSCSCPIGRQTVPPDTGVKPNTGFVKYPEDYDPRG